MTQSTGSLNSGDVLDELVFQLLDCGGVLSQIITTMIQCEAAGRSAPDAAPIPTAAHSVIRSVLTGLGRRHSRRDLRVAAAIVQEATDAIFENVFSVPLEDLPVSRGDAARSNTCAWRATSPGGWTGATAVSDVLMG